ncbi:MAG: hypothetical protein OHK93_003654 [Ramalina farinacea]|uniref:Uncharacterized protein n=1 Tax=Ramalina farinacea TaxID=258253 RepID=A0AA43QY50_9LECA|nr:hypothetical protein [Ramalina farinacea]
MPTASETPYKGAAETTGTSAAPTDTTRTEEFVDSDGNALTAEALKESEEEEDEAEAEIILENGMDVNKKADPPNKARKELYEKAAPAISALFENVDNSRAIAFLKETNKVIKILNFKELKEVDRNKYLIRIQILQTYFK